MISVLSCLAFEHDPIFVALAVLVLVVGSVVTMRLFARVRRSDGPVKTLWLFLSGLIAGGTIWSTHFVSMLAYRSDLILGYDLPLTGLSLGIAIVGTTLGLFIASLTRSSILIEVGGLVFGAAIAAMHYTGIYAIQLSGILQLDVTYVAASVLLGCLFGMLATSRIARPVTRFCKYGSALAFVLAVACLHYVGMTGLDLIPLKLSPQSGNLVSETLLGGAIVIIMGVFMVTAIAAYMIDAKNSADADGRYNHLARHDPLTGLANRAGIKGGIERTLADHKDDTARLAVVSFRLERFSDINAAHGQGTGDEVLRHVARQVMRVLKPTETAGRVDAQEFVILRYPVYTRGEVVSLCQRLEAVLADGFSYGGRALPTRPFFGYALAPDDGTTAGGLLDAAGKAARQSAEEGQGEIRAYDPSRDKETKERSELAIDLTHALEREEFELHYQIQNDVHSRRITGCEVLLRWQHPERGMVPPFKFIPIAEDTGLINRIGAWILSTACAEAASWPSPVKIAVNVAPVQLADPRFPDIVQSALTDSGLDPSLLELEITESGIIADTNHTLLVIQKLKAKGLKIAMDDFGTGYSSLATLQAFPFDKIKVDREFVKDLGQNKHSAAIIRSTVILADSLDIPVLAEGVETEEHMSFLKREGCSEVQGYLFSKPVPAAELRRQISDDIRKAANLPMREQGEPGVLPFHPKVAAQAGSTAS